MTAYALIFVNFPAGATLDEVAVLYHSDTSAFYWHCLLLHMGPEGVLNWKKTPIFFVDAKRSQIAQEFQKHKS